MNRIFLALAVSFQLAVADAADKPAPSGAVSKSASAVAGKAVLLFNGKSLQGWRVSEFAANGGATVDTEFKDGPVLIVDQGEVLSGVTYTNTNAVPRVNYEVSLEAMKLSGSDFMCGLTFPVKQSHATLVLGGWGGGVVGISSIDGSDASENETTKYHKFDKDVWYRVRVRVTDQKIEAWLDDDKIADVETDGKRIEMRPGEIESAVPLSLSTYQTRAAYRNIRLQPIPPAK